MKKLLAMYICVSALVYGFNAKASGLDMPPLDNSHTQFSLVPESVFDNSSSFQMARTYFMPDYQRNLVGRVNDGGNDKNKRTCATYGLLSSCPARSVGTGVQHPIPGLTCYKKCVSCTDFGYVSRCPLLKEGTEVSPIDGLTCYKDCRCPAEYKYSNVYLMNSMLDGSVRTRCSSPAVVAGGYCQTTPPASITATGDVFLYMQCNCPSDYDLTAKLENATCETCTAGSTKKYKCTCNDGYSLSGGKCVALCRDYPLTGTCPEGCNCTSCPSDSSKYKIDGAKTSEGWKLANGTCEAVPCPADYTRGVTKCSDTQKYTYFSSGKSGGEVCGKCTAKDDNCPTDYSKTACTSTQKQMASTQTDAGSTCYLCQNDTCASGYSKTACTSSQKIANTTTTAAGTVCYQCAKLTCDDYGYQSSVASKELCRRVVPKDTSLTCFTECKQGCVLGGYADSDQNNVLFSKGERKDGFYYNKNYYLVIPHPWNTSTHTSGTGSITYESADKYCSVNGYEMPPRNTENIIRNGLGYNTVWTSMSDRKDMHYGCALHSACDMLKDDTKLEQSVCLRNVCLCPSGSALEGQCGTYYTQDKNTVVKTLDDGRKCYKCIYGSGSSGSDSGKEYEDVEFTFEVEFYGLDGGFHESAKLYFELQDLQGSYLASATVECPANASFSDGKHIMTAKFDKKITLYTTVKAYLQVTRGNSGGNNMHTGCSASIDGKAVGAIPSCPGDIQDVVIRITPEGTHKVVVRYALGKAGCPLSASK